LQQTIIGCVMYGRDNDSYASVAGSLAGAFHGIEAIPEAWIQPVIDGNPEIDMHDLARKLTQIIAQDYQKSFLAWQNVGQLLS
ncbi:MAG: ADP-ribosylglycohydrolase family protein, partial [Chloroflexota bacterium]